MCLDTFLSPTFWATSTAFLVDRGVGHWDGTAVGCNSQNTKLPELRFRAILDDGVRDIRFERATSKTEAGNR